MTISNIEIAEKFYEIADLLEIENSNFFKVKAYRNAAKIIKSLPKEICETIDKRNPKIDILGIGKDLVAKIHEIISLKNFSTLENKIQIPTELINLLKIPDLGHRRIRKLHKELHINNIQDLNRAITNDELLKLKGFGENIQKKIKTILSDTSLIEKKFIYPIVEKIANQFINYIKEQKHVEDIRIAGSFRRKKYIVNNLNVLVLCKPNSKDSLKKHILNYASIKEILKQEEDCLLFTLYNNFKVDLQILDDKSEFICGLKYFTGSKNHNESTKHFASKRNINIEKNALYISREKTKINSEKELFEKISLPFIEPELRENKGEIEKALQNDLPDLIKIEDIKGDLHCHTNYTDGQNDLELMAHAAQNLGYEYIAITDHSKKLKIVNGLDEKRLSEQIKKIDELNSHFKKIRILKGIEVDILEDGTLDLPDDILKKLDIRVCSIHYKFNLSKEKQTQRILKAMDNPYFNILAHPTGRLINKRMPYEIDIEEIMLKAKEKNCIMEINCQPDRMDLNERNCELAKKIGIKISIATDAHDTQSFNYVKYGVNQARRAWMNKGDVINTFKLKDLLELIKK